MKRYKKVEAGVWQQPKTKGYLLQCCDCGLVHTMEFRIFNGKVQMRGWRAEWETKQVRKKRNISVRT